MTLSELRTEVDYKRRDTTESFITYDEITAYFNQCLRDIKNDYEYDWMQTSCSVTFASGTSAYALSAIAPDFLAPIDLYYDNTHQFEWVTLEDFKRLSSSSANNMWATQGQQIFFNGQTGNLTMQYYSDYMAQTSGGSRTLQLTALDDEPIIPVRFQDCLTDYAWMKIASKEGLTDDYGIANQDYNKKILTMKTEYPSKRKYPLNRMKHINEITIGNTPYSPKENPLNQ